MGTEMGCEKGVLLGGNAHHNEPLLPRLLLSRRQLGLRRLRSRGSRTKARCTTPTLSNQRRVSCNFQHPCTVECELDPRKRYSPFFRQKRKLPHDEASSLQTTGQYVKHPNVWIAYFNQPGCGEYLSFSPPLGYILMNFLRIGCQERGFGGLRNRISHRIHRIELGFPGA